MTTSLSLYNTSTGSSVLSNAELLVSTGGGAKGSTQSTNIGSHLNWIEVGFGTGNALAGATSIQAPDGTGAFFDGSTLVGQQLIAGNYSATLTLTLDQAGKQIVGDITLRLYKYNSSTTTYTSIGNLTQTGVTITSSDTTVNFTSTSLPAMTFASGESLYIDCWMNLTSNTMISGGHILNYESSSATLGWIGSLLVTPGYGPPSTSITGTDQLNSTEIDILVDVFSPAETLTIGVEVDAVAIAFAPIETASLADTSVMVSQPIGITGADQLTVSDSASSFVLTSNLSDITAIGADRLARVVPSTFQTDQLTLSDNIALTLAEAISDLLATSDVQTSSIVFSATDSLTETSSMTYWSQPLFLFFTDGLLTPSEQGFFYPRRADLGYTLLALDSFRRANVASGLGIASDVNIWQFLAVTGASAPAAVVSGNQGSLTNAGTDTPYVLGTASNDAEIFCRITPSNTGDLWGVLARATLSAGQLTAYRMVYDTGNIALRKTVAGTTTSLSSTAFSASINTAYYLRLRLVGSTLSGKIWQSGAAEPAAWTLTASDSAIAGPGQTGILANTATGSNAVLFDSFFAVDNFLLDALSSLDASAFGALRNLDPDILATDDSVAGTIIWPFTDQLSTSDSVSGGRLWPFTDIAPGPLSDSISFVNSANQGWTTLGLDTFIRANVSGSWGTATDGNTWAVTTGATPTLSIQSNQGLATGFTGQTFMRLGSATASDSEVIMRFLVPSANIVTLGVCLRLSGNTAYRARINTQNSSFGLIRIVSGSSTDLVTTAFTPTIGGYCWMRFRVQGTTLYGKVWKDGTAEPLAWTLTTTDSNIASGGVGLAINPAASGDVFKFDRFNAFDYALADNALIESGLFFIQEEMLEPESTPSTESLTTLLALPFAPEFVTLTDASAETLVSFAADALSISDNLDYTTPPFGLAEINQLTLSEISSFSVIYNPTEQLVDLEIVLESETFPVNVDSLANTETQLFTAIFQPTDLLSITDSIVQTDFSAIPAEEAGTVGDSFLTNVQPVFTDSLSEVESHTAALAYLDGGTLSLSDKLEYGVPSDFMDDVTPVQDENFSFALSLQSAESNVEAESAIFLEAGNYLESTLTTTEQNQEAITALLSGTATYTATLYSSIIITDGPVAYYRLNEASGSTAFDSTVNHHDATLNKMAEYSQSGAIIGDADTAISFDPNGGIILRHDLDISSFSALTLEYWINIEGTWMHVVTTLDNSAGIFTSYLNGDLYVSDTSGQTIVTETDFFASGTPKPGLLDEIAIYNKILTPTQIHYHYLAGSGALISAPLLLKDTIIASIPAQLNDDALSIAETSLFGDGNRYDLWTDQLSISDSLFVKDNFTDSVVVLEGLLSTVESTILEPRSVLYSNIIADAPSAYWQLNEDVFAGIFQRNGQDQPNNASNPYLLGATLEYTWSQIEPVEGNLLWDIIDADILPWKNQAKNVILRIYTASTPLHNSLPYLNNTAGRATPQWVFDAGTPAVGGLDGATYPVYWNAVYQQKYATFIQEFANRYDTNSTVAAVVISCGVNGSTQIEASGDSTANTLELWTPRGYTPQAWVDAIDWTISTYQNVFQHTSLILSVNSAFIQPSSTFNIDQCISLAVAGGVWLMDENVYVGEAHNNPNWNVVPLISVPRKSAASGGDSVPAQLALESNYQSDYAAVWADDITGGANNTALAKYAGTVGTKKLTDSASGNFVMPTYGGVYPTAHIATGDYLNGAQQFNGLSGYGLLPAVPQTVVAAWTLKASIFPTVLPTQESIIVCNGQGGAVGAGGYALGIAGGSSGGVGSNFCVYLPGIGWYDSGYAFPAINQWYALFATWDGTTLKFYVNGAQTPNTYTISVLTVPATVTIGGIWDGFVRTATKLFIGSIDEVAIYPTAISSSRITALSNIEIGLIESPVGTTGIMNVTDSLTVSDDASSVTGIELLNDSALAVSDLIASSQVYATQAQPTILGRDDFNRLDQSGWGTANDGQVWTTVLGSPSLSILSNQAKFTNTAVGCTMLLGSATGTQEEGILRLTLSATGAPGVGIVLRATDGSNHYRARLSSTNLAIAKVVSGTVTNLATSTFAYSINTAYWIRFKAQGTNLQAKIWADGSAEPVAWTVSTTDATYNSGKIGIFAQLSSSSNNALFDNFFVVDNPLTDQMQISEQYVLTKILPPFVDTSIVVDASITIDNPTVIDVLTEIETDTVVTTATITDFLLLAASRQAWQEDVSLPDLTLAVSEKILTPVSRVLSDDPLTVVDVSIFVAGGGGFSQIAPTDLQSYAISKSQTDQLALIDKSVLTYERTFVDQLSTDDSSELTGVFLERNLLQSVENIFAADVFVPVDVPALTEKLQTSVSNLAVDAVSAVDSVTPTVRFVPVDATPTIESLNSYFAVSLIWGNPPPVSDAIFVVDATVSNEGTLANDSFEADTALTLPYDVQIPGESAVLTPEATWQDEVVAGETLISAVKQSAIDQCSTAETFLDNGIARSVDSLLIRDALSLVEAVSIGGLASLSDAILSIVTQGWSTQTNTISDAIRFTPNWLRIDLLASTEALAQVLAEALADSIIIAESEITSMLHRDTDVTSANEAPITTTVAFFTSDLSVASDVDFAVTYQSFSDTLSVAETSAITLNDRPVDIIASMSPFPVIALSYASGDTLNSVGNIKDSVSCTFPAETNAPTETISALTKTSFTGWTDVLNQVEHALFDDQFVPNEAALGTESLTASNSEILHEISTPVSEGAAYGLRGSIADVSHSIEILVPIIAPQDVNALQNFEDILFGIDQLERDTLLETEQASFSILALPLEQLAQRESLLATERLTQNEPSLTIIENRAYTTIMAPVETLPERGQLALAIAATFTETTPAGDIAPSIGYALSPDTLVLNEKLSYTRTAYEVVSAVVNTGTVTGRVLTGEVTGVVLTGAVEGIIP